MKKEDLKRIAAELTEDLRQNLERAINNAQWEDDWSGHHVRALASNIMAGELDVPCVKSALRRMKRSQFWCAFR